MKIEEPIFDHILIPIEIGHIHAHFFFRLLQILARPFFIKLFAIIFDQKRILCYVLLCLELLLFCYQVGILFIVYSRLLSSTTPTVRAIFQFNYN